MVRFSSRTAAPRGLLDAAAWRREIGARCQLDAECHSLVCCVVALAQGGSACAARATWFAWIQWTLRFAPTCGASRLIESTEAFAGQPERSCRVLRSGSSGEARSKSGSVTACRCMEAPLTGVDEGAAGNSLGKLGIAARILRASATRS